jgi:hypothetical protein
MRLTKKDIDIQNDHLSTDLKFVILKKFSVIILLFEPSIYQQDIMEFGFLISKRI